MARIGYFILGTLLFLCASVCKAQTNYVSKLISHEQFLKLEGKPLSEKYSGTQSVKVVLDLRRQKMYFLSAKAYRYHRDFCFKILGNTQELSQFNVTNYRSGNRREYVFANINFYPEKNIYTLEFSDIERFSHDVLQMFKMVKENSFIDEKLLFHPRTDAQVQFIQRLENPVKTITTNELYSGVSKQMLVQGTAIGILRKIHIDTLHKTQINPWDIVLTNGSPNDIDLCAGLIITKFQSPLSHINILCHNRGTPVMAYKDAFTDRDIKAFVNKPIRLQITDTYKITEATNKDFYRIKNEKILAPIKYLAVDRGYASLQNIEAYSQKDVAKIGGKAANLAELFNIKKLTKTCDLPSKAFAIPTPFYLSHFKASGAEQLLNNLLKDSAALYDKKILTARLKEIRKAITNYAINKKSTDLILEKFTALGYEKNERIRFRSSTNAEDIKGFNGAGLYNSYTGIYGITEGKTIERAIKKVWASTWNERAFRERQYFGINQKTVAMAILVHKAFGAEDVNGVVVSKNLYRKNDESFVINAQKGEVAIVAGSDTATAELSILSKSYSDGTMNNDYISYSSLNYEKPLMTSQQLSNLFTAIQRIKYHYYYNVREEQIQYSEYALDIEFKIKNGRVIIKQVRPYN